MDKIYHAALSLAESGKSGSPVFKITDPKLFREIMENFGPVLDQSNAKYSLESIYEAGIHKATGSLIVCNKGATLFTLSPKTSTPAIARHIGFSIYVPGVGIEFANVGLFGDVYNGKVVLRTESACAPSFLFGSQRCNCAHQWDMARELATYFNRLKEVPKISNGRAFEKWVQAQGKYMGGRHVLQNPGLGFVLVHIDTQNGMGSGFTPGEFSFDLFSKASMRHRGEYTIEQTYDTTMAGGFKGIGLRPDPRREHDNAGYKVTLILLDYLGVSKDLIILTNNLGKLEDLRKSGYKLKRLKIFGEINVPGAEEAEQRGTEFSHLDMSAEVVDFKNDYKRLKSEIKRLAHYRQVR